MEYKKKSTDQKRAVEHHTDAFRGNSIKVFLLGWFRARRNKQGIQNNSINRPVNDPPPANDPMLKPHMHLPTRC